MGMDELKPGKKFVGTVMIESGFHQYEADRARVLTANTPSLASAIGFQYRVAKAAKNQRPCHEGGCVIFNKQDGLHGHSVSPTGVGGIAFGNQPDSTGVSVVDMEHPRCRKQRLYGGQNVTPTRSPRQDRCTIQDGSD